MPSANLFELIVARSGRPDQMALETSDATSLTYAALFERSARAANALVALGVEPGDRVAAQVDKSTDVIVLALACLRAGAALLPLNTAYTLPELEYFLSDAEPALTVCRPASLAAVRDLARRLGLSAVESLGAARDGTLAERIAASAPDFETVPRRADDLAAILYTSGTTGRSKGAMLTHENLASNALTLVDCWRFTDADRLIHALPVFHTHGLFVAVNTALLAGATMIYQNRFDPDAVLAAMADATALMGVPTFYTRLLDHPGLTRAVAAGMRLFVSGSAPLLAETHAAWRERTGFAILERYGMTETNMITSNPYDGERRAGTVGLPLPGVGVRIAEPERGAPLPAGEIGVIEVKGPNVFKGYWRMPEKTAQEFRPDGWFITGDLGLFDPDGYVHIVGRAKDLVISGGFNVYPKEVESEIDAIEGVLESAVIGLPHPDFGEGVTAVVAIRPGAAVTEEGVLAALEGRLAKFKAPKRVFVVDELPRNSMGKVQKALLRETLKDTFR
ncbi:malonyl-CoA/methylmalonyl-CoA synthetase [Roseiarcus fermentans]|uniref:Malonyl-CoA/methylmalonyl-CoA synthetase n=1 Tax=Roseiarcus fermentans TaxID=1473586 RepID=A0A366FE00_9HYPH|nr:malonyl-CoA synthase [Roseiarcus fermentans]RBP12841.1 malonyl-CoA/methylmalonyl-CoA synthetase [Roseiarcus fermentans]